MAAARVLFVDHAPARGGAENSLLLLFEHLDHTRFITDGELRRTLGSAARADINTRFDVRQLTRQIEQVLDSVRA